MKLYSIPTTASVIIPTRNRSGELERALRSVLMQEGAEIEIIVIDDGSTDGTTQMVAEKFPTVKLKRFETSEGCIVRRNQAAKDAKGEILIWLDDDAEYSHPRIIAETLADFDHSKIGAVAMPCIEPSCENKVFQKAPCDSGMFVIDTYLGAAAAVRKDVFRRNGGYREEIQHQGEERDLCIWIIQFGYYVRMGRATNPVIHHISHRRSHVVMDYRGPFNSMRFAWNNVPGDYFPRDVMRTLLRTFIHGFRVRRPFVLWWGVFAGLCAGLWGQFVRDPVRPETYTKFRQFKNYCQIELS